MHEQMTKNVEKSGFETPAWGLNGERGFKFFGA